MFSCGRFQRLCQSALSLRTSRLSLWYRPEICKILNIMRRGGIFVKDVGWWPCSCSCCCSINYILNTHVSDLDKAFHHYYNQYLICACVRMNTILHKHAHYNDYRLRDWLATVRDDECVFNVLSRGVNWQGHFCQYLRVLSWAHRMFSFDYGLGWKKSFSLNRFFLCFNTPRNVLHKSRNFYPYLGIL